MAVGTTAAIMGGITAAGGIAKTISGASQTRNAKKALENFRMQELKNPYKDLSVSTLGADLQREESARLGASQLNALQQAGSRELVGGIGYLQKEKNRLNREIGSDLDRQRKDIDRLIAQDEARIRGIQEQRDLNTLSGLGRQLEVGRQDTMSGIGDIAQAGMFMANNLESNQSGMGYRPQVSQVSSLQQQGVTPFSQLPISSMPF